MYTLIEETRHDHMTDASQSHLIDGDELVLQRSLITLQVIAVLNISGFSLVSLSVPYIPARDVPVPLSVRVDHCFKTSTYTRRPDCPRTDRCHARE